MTCTHDNLGGGVSKWTFTSPTRDYCERPIIINHNFPDNVPPCGPFMFQNVTSLEPVPKLLSSMVIATAEGYMSNTTVECEDSAGTNVNQIGFITLCVIGM